MADELEIKAPKAVGKVEIKMEGTQEVYNFVETLNVMARGNQVQKYWKSQKVLIDDLTKACAAFNRTASEADAREILNVANALKSVAKSDDLSKIVTNYDKVGEAIAKATRQIGSSVSGELSRGVFDRAFSSFDLLKAHGLETEEVFSRIGRSNDVAVLTAQVERLTSSLAQETRKANEAQEALESFTAGTGIERLQGQIEELKSSLSDTRFDLDYLKDQALNEFYEFLHAYDISENEKVKGYDADGYEIEKRKFGSYIDAIKSGEMTAKEAIRGIKAEFSDLFSSKGIAMDEDLLQGFIDRLQTALRQIEEISNYVRGIGTITPEQVGVESFQRLADVMAEDEQLTEKQRDAFRSLAQEGQGITSVVDAVVTLLNNFESGGQEAAVGVNAVAKALESLQALAGSGSETLDSLSSGLYQLSRLDNFKAQVAPFEHLADGLARLAGSIERPEKLALLSGLNLKGLSDLKFTKTYEHLAANLPAISEVNVDNLVKLSNVNFQNLAGVTFKKSNIEALASLANVVQGLETLQTRVDEIQGRLAPTEPIIEPIATDDYVEPLEEAIEEVTQKTEEAAERRIEAEERVAEAAKQMAAEKEQVSESSGAAQEAVANAQELAESQRQIGISAQETKDQVTNAAQAEVEAIKEVTAAAKEQGRAADIAAKSMTMPGGFSQESINEIKEELIGKNVSSEQADRIANDFKNIRGEITKTKATVLDTANHTEKVVNVTIEAVEKLESGLKRITKKSTDYKFNRKDNDWERTDKEVVTLDYNGTRVDTTPTANNTKATAAALKEEEKALKSIVTLRNQIAVFESAKARPNVGKNEAAGIDLDIDEKNQEIERLFSRLSEITGKSRADLEATVGIIEKQTAAYADTERQIGRNEDAAVSAAEKERVATLKALADIKSARDKVLELRHKATQSGVDTDETRQLADIIKKYDELKKQLESGKISIDQYKEEVLGLKSAFSAVSGAVKTQIAVQGSFKKEIEQTAQKILSLEREANDYLVKSEKPGISTESAAEYKAAYEEREAAAKSLIGTLQGLMGVELNEVSSYLDSLRGASSNYRKFAEGMNANDESRKKKIYEQKAALAQLNNQLEQYIKTMKKSGAPADKIQGARDFIGDNNDWIKLLESGEVLPDEKIREATAAIRDFIAASREAGDAQETLGHQIMRVFSQKFGYAVMATLAMQVRKAIRQIYTNVVELDTAMTELRKVTDETAASYERFLENAAQGAQKLGVSMTELVNATADFARLGYNIVDANTLAEVATVYKNVGDGITSIDEASSSIISTMKAFKMEASDAMLIVDKFNHTGKMSCPAA